MITRSLQHSLALSSSPFLATTTHLPPTFLLPLRAHLTTTPSASTPSTTTTTTHTLDPNPPLHAYDSQPHPPPLPSSPIPPSQTHTSAINPPRNLPPQLSRHTPFKSPLPLPQTAGPSKPLLLALAAQKPHYIVAHLHARPYLLTEGDLLRLPFRMPDASTGTIIRLNRASVLGSRDFTFRAGAGVGAAAAGDKEGGVEGGGRQGKGVWIDEKYFSCRAMVVGVEGEPMRIMLKTKRRQRHVKRVFSKGRFTVLRIIELRVTPEGNGVISESNEGEED